MKTVLARSIEPKGMRTSAASPVARSVRTVISSAVASVRVPRTRRAPLTASVVLMTTSCADVTGEVLRVAQPALEARARHLEHVPARRGEVVALVQDGRHGRGQLEQWSRGRRRQGAPPRPARWHRNALRPRSPSPAACTAGLNASAICSSAPISPPLRSRFLIQKRGHPARQASPRPTSPLGDNEYYSPGRSRYTLGVHVAALAGRPSPGHRGPVCHPSGCSLPAHFQRK